MELILMRSRLKANHRKPLETIYAITFENKFDKTSGVFLFKDKSNADYLYRIADHVECKTAALQNAEIISDMQSDIFDYGLIRINKLINQAICKVKNIQKIMYINGQAYKIQQIGDQSIITYMKEG